EKELATARERGQSLDERWHVRRDGRRIWGMGTVTALMDNGQLRGYVKIMRDNTEQKLNEERLESTRREAERANEAKDHFLATVSHELRTPLSSIFLWAKMLTQGALAPNEISSAAAAIERSAEAQKRLIEDLLDISLGASAPCVSI